MRIIFIRHAEPDYVNDTLTEKGFREAEILAGRTADWKVDHVYVSPMPRAQYTMNPSLKNWQEKNPSLKPVTYEWLQEIYYRIKDPVTGDERIAWDFYPEYFTGYTELHDKDKWFDTPVMKSGDIKSHYEDVINGFNELLANHGYVAKGNGLFEVKEHNDDTIVLVCHLGVTFAMLGYLTGIASPSLWQGFFVAPTSITVVSSDERDAGKGCAFRVQTFGDASHLREAGEPISQSGYFSEMFQQ